MIPLSLKKAPSPSTVNWNPASQVKTKVEGAVEFQLNAKAHWCNLSCMYDLKLDAEMSMAPSAMEVVSKTELGQLVLHMDEGKVLQVIRNLLSNSVSKLS